MTLRPTTFDEFMGVQHLGAINVTGADHSSWNGDLGETTGLSDDGGIILGTATANHELLFHEDRVYKSLREMFLRSGQQHDDKTLMRFRYALDIVFHENLHMLAGAGTEYRDAATALLSPEVRALEEGATATYSTLALNQYIGELQLERVVPRITQVVTPRLYPRFSPAADTLTRGLGGLSGEGQEEVLRRLNIVNARDKWPIATDIIAKAHRLDELVHWGQLVHVKAQIETVLRTEFARLPTLDIKPRATLLSRSADIGTRAFHDANELAGKLRIQAIAILPPVSTRRNQSSDTQRSRPWSSRPDRGTERS